MSQVLPKDVPQTLTKWKRYSAYKDSGVEWLGEIPTHWEVNRLKYAAPVSTTKLSDKPDELPYLGLEHIESKTGRILLDVVIENVESTVALFEQGNVLFGKLRPYLAKVVYTTFRGVCTTELLALQPCYYTDGKFLFYQLLADSFIDLVNSLTYGTKMPRVSSEQISNLSVVIPSLTEQKAIASFLDRETAKIDALIAKKERLIELLEEQRTAIISHAVTKGLDPTVSLKDSGVEWLGDIPAHWDVAPVYARYSVQLGKMLNQEAVRGVASAPYLRNANIQWDRFDLTDLLEMDFDSTERRKYALIPGDLLVCEGGEVGRTAIWQGELTECYFQKTVHRLRSLRNTEEGRFFFYVLYTAAKRGVFVADGSKNTIAHLTAEKLKKHRFAFPPYQEQQAIASFLDRETAKIDALIAKIREGIENLKEYRTALISAAVTGKIDVRNEVAS